MSWRTAAAVFIVVLAIGLVQMVLAGPLMTFSTDLNDTGDYDNEHFDGNSRITSYPQDWFHMGLVAIFGIMMWGAARVVRKELTRGRGP